MKTLLATALLATLPLLGACAERNAAPVGSDPSTNRAEPETVIGRSVAKAMDKAREKLATENIDLNDMHVDGDGDGIRIGNRDDHGDDRPKAELTPQGELLIEGRKVDANAEQQALLRQYRRQIEGVASAGMDIGAQGAELGVKAAKEALLGIFSGDTEEIERKVEAEAEGIKAAARQLCNQLPGLKDTQDALAASMPEFRPYATLDQADIDDCYEDDHAVAVQRGVRQDVQREVRETVRETVRGSVRQARDVTRDVVRNDDDDMNAAEEAEAASAESGDTR